MKKLSVLVALIMAITVFWIPGQSVFADNEEGDDATVQAMAETYTITFVANGGSPVASQDIEEGQTVTEPKTEWDGHSFKGWYKGDELYDFSKPVTSSFTLTAHWEEETQEPVPAEFKVTSIRPSTGSIYVAWEWTDGEGDKNVSVTLYRNRISDRNSNYSYYKKSDTFSGDNSFTFTGLDDGTDYYLIVTVNGKNRASSQINTTAKKANGWLGRNYYINKIKQRRTTVQLPADGSRLNHYFDCNGNFVGRRDYMYSSIKGLSSKTAYLICVDRTNNVVCVYRGKQNKWQPYKYWSCVTGRMKKGDYHPTPLGVYKVKSKKTTFSGYGIPEKKKNRYSVWYCTRFTGSVFFHSQLYKFKSKSSFIPGGAAMGRNASHGCIRLHKANAYWVYKNIGKGTTVRVIQ